jgi:hypothetical protein
MKDVTSDTVNYREIQARIQKDMVRITGGYSKRRISQGDSQGNSRILKVI